MVRQVDEGPKRVSLWLDVLIAIWLVIAVSAFLGKLLSGTGMTPVVRLGEYSYALVLISCVVACGLAIARGLVRNR